MPGRTGSFLKACPQMMAHRAAGIQRQVIPPLKALPKCRRAFRMRLPQAMAWTASRSLTALQIL